MTVNEALKLWDYRDFGIALWYNSGSACEVELLYYGNAMDKMPNEYGDLEFVSFIRNPKILYMFENDTNFIHIKVEYKEKKEPDYKELWKDLYEFVENSAMYGSTIDYHTIWTLMGKMASENADEDTKSYPIETVLRAVRKIGKEYEADNAAAAVSFLLVTLGDLSRRGYETVLRANEKWYVVGGDKETAINFSGCIILNWLWSRNRLEEKE